MSLSPQASADAASESYTDRSQRDVESQQFVSLKSTNDYTVFGYKHDPASGFHATAYREVAPPHNIIITYRGPGPGLLSGNAKLDHALATAQDITVDATMVRDHVNLQMLHRLRPCQEEPSPRFY